MAKQQEYLPNYAVRGRSGGTRYAADDATAGRNVDFPSAMEEAARLGKSQRQQKAELKALKGAGGDVQALDYYYYRMYDPRYSRGDQLRFVGNKFYFSIIDKVCDLDWKLLVDDKFWANVALGTNGLPVAHIQAVLADGARTFGDQPKLSTEAEAEAFFRDKASYPVFAKPMRGIGSFGAFLITGYGRGGLELHGGETMEVGDFLLDIDLGHGYLLQDNIATHPALSDVVSQVSTVRLVVVVPSSGPRVTHAVWKIPSQSAIADNFWRTGNLIAAIDHETGRIERAVTGSGSEIVEHDTHPETGAQLVGRQLPGWDAVVDTCLRGAQLIAPVGFQSWDIALGDNGPVILEANIGSAFNLMQLSQGRGFLTDDFLAFLKERRVSLGKDLDALTS